MISGWVKELFTGVFCEENLFYKDFMFKKFQNTITLLNPLVKNRHKICLIDQKGLNLMIIDIFVMFFCKTNANANDHVNFIL